ncbi:MAG: hypothetical protein AAB546_04470 [Patescibacteria group bacterium]
MNKGNSSLIIILLVLAIVLVGASAASYYLLKSQGVDVASQTPLTSGISDKDDLTTLEKELENTDPGSTDADLQDLDSQTTGL